MEINEFYSNLNSEISSAKTSKYLTFLQRRSANFSRNVSSDPYISTAIKNQVTNKHKKVVKKINSKKKSLN